MAMIGDNTIRLAVAVFHSTSEKPSPDPVVYHVGGPGGHMLGIIAYGLFDKVIAPFLQYRDLILFDPRGTGYSEPSLECSPGEDPGDCVRRLFSEGRNLYAYNSSSMAADLQDIRRALGYDQWNLFGESYGTHVAQVAMREQPEGLRSVILDAVLPIQLPPLPGNNSEFELSLGRLFDRCRQNQECNAAYPDLPSAYARAVERLDRQPVTLSFELDGTTREAILSGEQQSEWTMTALYEAEMIPYLPFAITAAASGSSYEFWDYTAKWEINTDKMLSGGAHWAILCGDDRLGGCDNWPIAIEQEPVSSDLPTLLLSGEFDPVTPPDYAHSVALSLNHSYLVDLPGFGHWANGTGHPCPSAIIQAFLADPTGRPGDACLQDLEEFQFFSGEDIP
jgi:pimeloyl-ACP methyl ester carboxylesterase